MFCHKKHVIFLLPFIVVLGGWPACSSAEPSAYDGRFKATYACSNNSSPGARFPGRFSLPLDLRISEGNVLATRNAPGEIEEFRGRVDASGKLVVLLEGHWRDKPTARWTVRFSGRIASGMAFASGEMLAANGTTKVRDCTLAFSLPPPAAVAGTVRPGRSGTVTGAASAAPQKSIAQEASGKVILPGQPQAKRDEMPTSNEENQSNELSAGHPTVGIDPEANPVPAQPSPSKAADRPRAPDIVAPANPSQPPPAAAEKAPDSGRKSAPTGPQQERRTVKSPTDI